MTTIVRSETSRFGTAETSLMRDPAFLKRLADGLIRNDDRMWQLLAAKAPYAGQDELTGIGESVAAALAGRVPARTLIRRLALLPGPILDALGQSLRDSPALSAEGVSFWPPELVRAACRSGAARVDDDVSRALLTAYSRKGEPDWLGDRSVPSSVRADLAKRVIVGDPAGPADRLSADPDVVASLFISGPSALAATCRTMTPDGRRWMTCLVIKQLLAGTIQLQDDHAPVLDDLIRELPPAEQLEAWRLIRNAAGPFGAEAEHAVDRCVRSYLTLAVRDYRLPIDGDLTYLIDAVPACRRWAALLRAAPTGQAGSVEEALVAFAGPERLTASLLALDFLVHMMPRTSEALSVAHRLASTGEVVPTHRALRYLSAAFRQAVQADRPSILVWALELVIQSGDVTPTLAQRFRSLLAPQSRLHGSRALRREAGHALSWLAAAAPEQFRALAGIVPRSYGPRAARWLRRSARAGGTRLR